MDKLWYFADQSQVYWVPTADSIIDEAGAPLASAATYKIDANSFEEFKTFCDRSDQFVLVGNQQTFNPDYLQVIPSDAPRIALVNALAAGEVKTQLKDFDCDAVLFSPFASEAITHSLAKTYEDKNSFVALQDEVKRFSDIAFTAMSSASEMGVVAFYAQSVQNTLEFQKLAHQTLNCLKDLSVQAYVQFSFDDSVHYFPENISSNYRELLEWIRSSENRIVTHGRFMIFNFENVQILILDAPLDDSDKCGRLRDVIAHIASIAEARAKTIKVNELLKAQQDNTRRVITLLEMSARDNRNSVKTIMTDLSMSLREQAMGMDLTLEQEQALMMQSEKALESLECLQEATEAVDVHFRSILLQLDAAAKLLEVTEHPEEETDSGSNVELF